MSGSTRTYAGSRITATPRLTRTSTSAPTLAARTLWPSVRGAGGVAAGGPADRPEQAVDGWQKVFAFYEKYLGAPVPVAAAARTAARHG